MEIYNEDEQVEALKRWWDEYGTKVIVALVVVLAGVFGWKTWQNHREQTAEAASGQYQTMLDAMDNKDSKAAVAAGKDLLVAHGDSEYAVIAALNLAKLAVDDKNYKEAASRLQWAIDHAKKAEYQNLAKVRLAQVELALGHKDEALAVVQDVDHSAGAFKPLFEETRGDIYVAMGEREKALKAYTDALSGYPQVGGKRAQLKMKLDDLTPTKEKSE